MQIGKYLVQSEVGSGGFGVIYLARDTALDRDVALKVLRREHVADREVVQRFLQEARAAAKVDHPGIVTVFECGIVDEDRSPLDGTVYIAMELLRGETLSLRLERGPLLLAETIAIGRQAAAALGAAHRAAIIHRDLKPDNVFLCPDRAVVGGERVKILDFGIAKLAESMWQSDVKTAGTVVLGTPMYMSPEQCRSLADVDARADIYALGCILYQLVCSRPPYLGDGGQLLAMHQLAPVPDPAELAPGLPPPIAALIRAMLAKEPADRPQTMEEVEARLDASSSINVVAPISPKALPSAPTLAIVADPPKRRRGWLFGVLAVAGAGLGALLAIRMTGDKPPPVPDEAPVVAIIAIDAAPPDVFIEPEPEPEPEPAPPPPIDAGVPHAHAPPPHHAKPAPPPDAGVSVGSGSAACDAALHLRDAKAAIARGDHHAGIIALEQSMHCQHDPHVLVLAFSESCAAHMSKRARRLFKRLPKTGPESQETLRHLCDDVGTKLDATNPAE